MKKFLLKTFTPSEEDLNLIPSYHLINVEELSKYGVMGNFHGFKPKIQNLPRACQIEAVGLDVPSAGEKL